VPIEVVINGLERCERVTRSGVAIAHAARPTGSSISPIQATAYRQARLNIARARGAQPAV
jgi:hypothetical protein